MSSSKFKLSRRDLFWTSGATLALLRCGSGGDRTAERSLRAIELPKQTAPGRPYVLTFDGTQRAIDHGVFWPAGRELGNKFWWDFWVAPTGPGLLISDGGDGSNGLTLGFDSQGRLTGSVGLAQGPVAIGSDDALTWGEWAYVAVAGDGTHVRTYINGVCAGRVEMTSARRAKQDGRLLVGGHAGKRFNGRVAWLRAWEDDKHPILLSESAFIPERSPRHEWQVGGDYILADFLADYTVPRSTVPDLSAKGSRGAYHDGQLEGTGDTAAPPTWTLDPTCPLVLDAPVPSPVQRARTPKPVPAGALIWDSFQRDNQTFAYQKMPSLGMTEGGTRGKLAWKTSSAIIGANPTRPALFGILDGKAVYLNDRAINIAWVDCGTPNFKVSVSNGHGRFGALTVGVCFRVQDDQNYRYIYVQEDRRFDHAAVYEGLAGAPENTINHIYRLPPQLETESARWTRLSVVCKGDEIQVLFDDIEWLKFTGQTRLMNATGVGIVSVYKVPSSLSRYVDFRVDPVT